MTTPTPDASGQVAEGNVICFPEGWNGHKFWLAIGGYTNGDAQQENPLLLCCDTYPDPNDATSQVWSVPAGITNPLAPSPGSPSHNYDIGLAYDPVGDQLVIIYGVYASTTYAWNYLLYDGATVTGPFTLRPSSSITSSYTNSFNLLWDGSQWHGWAVSILSTNKNKIFHYTASTLAGMQSAVASVCTINGSLPAGRNLWEMNVALSGGQFVASITTATDLSGTATEMHLMTSGDGGTWTFSTNPVLSANPTPGQWDSGQVYRGGIVPLQPGGKGQQLLGLYYTANDTGSSGNWFMGYTEATFNAQALDSGTSFPSFPQTDDIFFRTDRGLEYFYDGTRWLTTTLYTESQQFAGAASNASVYVQPWNHTYDIYIEDFETVMFAAGISGASYWTLALDGATAANASTTIASADQSADTASTWTVHTSAVDATLSSLGTFVQMLGTITKTGTPGNLYATFGFTYRLVG